MRVKWRHLVSRVDLDAVPRKDVDGTVLDPPRKVKSFDGLDELERVEAMVRSGKLEPSDLVDVGRGWESVEDCLELADALAAVPRSQRIARGLREDFRGTRVLRDGMGQLGKAFLIQVIVGIVGLLAVLVIWRIVAR